MKVGWIIRVAVVWAVFAGAALGQDMRPVPRPERAAAAPVSETPSADASETPSETFVASSRAPAPRPATLLAGQELRLALSAARDGDWRTAGALADADDPVTAAIIDWQRLRAGRGNFADYLGFLAKYPDWPGLDYLRKRGEAAIADGVNPDLVIGYFKDTPPQSGRGALRLAAAHLAKGEKARAEAVLIAAWTGLELSGTEEKAFLADHGALLKPHHAARLDHLLWIKERADATRMLPLVDAGHQALAKARIALQTRAGGVDKAIEAVPAALAADPGLSFDRMDWQVAKRRRDTAAELILQHSTSRDTLGHPEAWAAWRRILARQTMRGGDGARAYALASGHHLSDGSDYADLEWLSGYLALTYLNKPDQALAHFKAFREAIFTPISLGRAFYWQGRAYEALGDAEAAKAAYAEGGQHQTSFYGLLAAEKAGLPMDPALTGLAPAETWQDAAFTRSSVFQAADKFYQAGQPWETARFLSHLTESLGDTELVQLTDYTLSLGDPFLAVRVGKQAAEEGTVAPRAYYPLTPLGNAALPVPDALALSIARRESEFHPAAVSHAGARGLMQLMPATAKQMATSLGLPYSRDRLTSDPDYNVRLGSAYLAHLIEEFGDNIVLVSVGYNAGPHRARSWIEANGDPRDASVDVVDWIEHIPFNETQNYVMRVAESLPVYRARLTGQVAPIRLSAELKAK